MDSAQYDRMMDWVRGNVGDRISKRELMSKAYASDLPQEVKRVFEELPDERMSKNGLVDRLRDIAITKFGAGMGASMSGLSGGGGIFGE